jgi:hypothetical protein
LIAIKFLNTVIIKIIRKYPTFKTLQYIENRQLRFNPNHNQMILCL